MEVDLRYSYPSETVSDIPGWSPDSARLKSPPKDPPAPKTNRPCLRSLLILPGPGKTGVGIRHCPAFLKPSKGSSVFSFRQAPRLARGWKDRIRSGAENFLRFPQET